MLEITKFLEDNHPHSNENRHVEMSDLLQKYIMTSFASHAHCNKTNSLERKIQFQRNKEMGFVQLISPQQLQETFVIPIIIIKNNTLFTRK